MRLWTAVLLAAAVLVPAAPAAARTTLPAPAVGRTAPYALLETSPRVDYAVWTSSPTELTVRTDAGAQTAYPVPANCTPGATAPGLVVLTCLADYPNTISFLHLPGGEVERSTVTAQMAVGSFGGVSPIAAGRRWLHFSADLPIVSPEFLYHRASGRVIELLEDPFGRARAIDLDAPSGTVGLCAGLRRTVVEPFKNSAKYGAAVRLGDRALANGKFANCRRGKVNPGVRGFNARYSLRGRRLTRFADGRRFTGPARATLSRGSAWAVDFATGEVLQATPP